MWNVTRFALLVPMIATAAGPETSRAPMALVEVRIEPMSGIASEFSYAPQADLVAWRCDWASGCAGIWVSDRAGTEQRCAVFDGEGEVVHVLAIAPDGRHLAYARTTAQSPVRTLGVGVVSLETGARIDVRGASAAWTPKGDRLAVADLARGTITVLEGAELEKRSVIITPCTGSLSAQPSLAWSPDGSKLAYVIEEPERPMTSLWVAVLGEGDPRLAVADGERCVSLVPFWSPDGRLAWRQTDLNDPVGSRHLVKGADEQISEIGHGLAIDPAGVPAWSPDGKRIVFLRTVPAEGDCAAKTDLWAIDVSSGDLERLTESGDAFGQVVWSLDGGMVFLQESRRLRCATLSAR